MGVSDIQYYVKLKEGPQNIRNMMEFFSQIPKERRGNLSAVKLEVKIGLQGCVLSISKRLATPPPAA